MSTTPTTRRTPQQEASRVYRLLLEAGGNARQAGLYCLIGDRSNELITLGGRLIVHDNKHELALLMTGVRIVPVPLSAGDKLEHFVPIAALEENTALLWPLSPLDFRQDGDGMTVPEPQRLEVPDPSRGG